MGSKTIRDQLMSRSFWGQARAAELQFGAGCSLDPKVFETTAKNLKERHSGPSCHVFLGSMKKQPPSCSDFGEIVGPTVSPDVDKYCAITHDSTSSSVVSAVLSLEDSTYYP